MVWPHQGLAALAACRVSLTAPCCRSSVQLWLLGGTSESLKDSEARLDGVESSRRLIWSKEMMKELEAALEKNIFYKRSRDQESCDVMGAFFCFASKSVYATAMSRAEKPLASQDFRQLPANRCELWLRARCVASAR